MRVWALLAGGLSAPWLPARDYRARAASCPCWRPIRRALLATASTEGATAKLRADLGWCALGATRTLRTALFEATRRPRPEHTATVRMSSASLPDLTLYKPRSIRLDVAPFVVLYPTLFSVYLFAYAPSTVLYANFAVPAVVACHLLTFLATHWSLPMRCLLQFRRVKTVADAQYVRVRPSASSGGGRPELCTLEKREAFNTAAADEEEVRFEHRKRTYLFSPPKTAVSDEASCFGELVMPLNLPITYYLNGAKGLRGEALSHATHKYGAQRLRDPAALVWRVIVGARIGAILRVPGLLRRAVVAGRLLVLFPHPRNARRLRVYSRHLPAT